MTNFVGLSTGEAGAALSKSGSGVVSLFFHVDFVLLMLTLFNIVSVPKVEEKNVELFKALEFCVFLYFSKIVISEDRRFIKLFPLFLRPTYQPMQVKNNRI